MVIGINYKNGPLPELNNAENDAQSVHDILIKHYGYKSTNIKKLLGFDATSEAVRSSLGGEFLGNGSKVQNDDSVLVFFAGHGHRIRSGEGQLGGIFLFDAQLQEQGQVPTYVSVLSYKNEIVPLLQNCGAQAQSFVILNCCYAGEIFTEQLYPLSKS